MLGPEGDTQFCSLVFLPPKLSNGFVLGPWELCTRSQEGSWLGCRIFLPYWGACKDMAVIQRHCRNGFEEACYLSRYVRFPNALILRYRGFERRKKAKRLKSKTGGKAADGEAVYQYGCCTSWSSLIGNSCRMHGRLAARKRSPIAGRVQRKPRDLNKTCQSLVTLCGSNCRPCAQQMADQCV